jgi:hypothetical protein
MEKIKTILDRKPLSSDYIRSKQDFGKVMKGAHLKPPIYKSAWFYGTVGLAAIAIAITVISIGDPEIPDQPEIATTTTIDNAYNYEANRKLPEETTLLDQNDEEVTPVTNEVREIKENAPSENHISEVEESPVLERQEPEVKPEVVESKNMTPNIAGFDGGPISFKDFCDPMGIQVNEDVSIVEYVIQYDSCTGERTARIRGNRIPSVVCEEISNCGKNVNVHIMRIKGYDKKANKAISFNNIDFVTTM